MKYLSRNNKPSRVNTKQLSKYFNAKSEGISYNEHYNEKVLGISTLLYRWIDLAISQNYGSMVDRKNIRLAVLNRWLQGDSHIYDDQGRLLSYLGKTYRV